MDKLAGGLLEFGGVQRLLNLVPERPGRVLSDMIVNLQKLLFLRLVV